MNTSRKFVLAVFGFLTLIILNYMIVFLGTEGLWYLITGTKITIDWTTSLLIIVGLTGGSIGFAIVAASLYDRFVWEETLKANEGIIPSPGANE